MHVFYILLSTVYISMFFLFSEAGKYGKYQEVIYFFNKNQKVVFTFFYVKGLEHYKMSKRPQNYDKGTRV